MRSGDVPIVTFALTLALGGVAYYVFEPPLVLALIYAVPFVIGFWALPALAHLGTGAVPLLVAEPIANIMTRFGMTALGEGVLTHTETGEYEIRYPDDETSDNVPKRWERFAAGRFAIGYERTEQYVGDLHWADGAEVIQTKVAETDGGVTIIDELTRGNEQAYVPRIARAGDKLLILYGEAMARFKDVGGLEGVRRGAVQATQEFGGDTGGYSGRGLWAAMAGFLVFGTMLGWVVFF